MAEWIPAAFGFKVAPEFLKVRRGPHLLEKKDIRIRCFDRLAHGPFLGLRLGMLKAELACVPTVILKVVADIERSHDNRLRQGRPLDGKNRGRR
jgi:hypothetical protein